MHTEIVIVGAGGHAGVVVDAVESNAVAMGLRVVDADKNKIGTHLLGQTVQDLPSWDVVSKCCVHIAIGENSIRAKIARNVVHNGHELHTIVHDGSTVSKYSDIGPGSFVAASSVVGAGAKLGSCVIVNHGAVVDHDCCIGDFTHIAPNATIGGGCDIGESVLIGAGSTLLPGITIGDNIVIGAGAVVTADIEGQGGTYIGIPARRAHHERD